MRRSSPPHRRAHRAAIVRARALARRCRLAAALATVALLPAACEAPPVQWSATRTLAEQDAGGTLVLDDAGRPRVSAVPVALLSPVAFAPEGACPGSEREADGGGRGRIAVWWAARADSSAVLRAAHSADGKRWDAPMVVDSTDRGILGCRRPAPGVAYDPRSGFAHVVYFRRGAEGVGGVMYAHQMDPRAPFEPPVPVVYGERPAAAAVAADGDLVAVAYEDPNDDRGRVVLALSRTAGHGTASTPAFLATAVDVSGDDTPASAPQVVVRAPRLAVAWLQDGRRLLGRAGTIR